MKKYADPGTPILVTALLVGIAAHAPFIPWWINLWCFSLWVYLLLAHRYSLQLPPKLVRIGLTIIAFTAIFMSTGRSFSNDAGIKLLCLMASLKPFEINNHRDRMITIFLAYFMVVSSLFFSTTIPMTLYMVVSVIIITGLLIRINHNEIPLTATMKLAGIITVQAIPLMLILFFLFPRLQGNFWGIHQRKTGITGFSSTLSPGSVSGIVKNKAVAFRATFEGKKPDYKDLYWRGIVFQYFTGKQWKARRYTPQAVQPVQGRLPVSYKVFLEPGNSTWIFALDLPGNIPAGTRLLADNTLVSKRTTLKKTSYDLISYIDYTTGPMDSWETLTRQLPDYGNPKSRELALRLFDESVSPAEYISRVINFFSENEFYYTLNPPIPGQDGIDDFLFKDMKGYCEHYASAFVFLMRAAGVPARIVGGYMGGEQNPYGNYLIVRQSDAHAWAEVWLKNKGWVRVDPTSAVAPERVETGISSALPQNEISGFFTTDQSGGLAKLFQNLELSWDAVNYHWDTKIIGYTLKRQENLLGKLGFNFKSLKNVLLVIAGGLGAIVILLLIFFLRLRTTITRYEDPVFGLYRSFTKKLKTVGITKPSWSGPLDFAEKAISQRPDMTAEINGITRLYILIRYGGKQDHPQLQTDFRKLVKTFKPKLMAS